MRTFQNLRLLKQPFYLFLTVSFLFIPGQVWSESRAPEEAGEVRQDSIKAEESELKIYLFEPVIVTATRTQREAFNTPRAITIVDRRELNSKNELSVLDALRGQIGIWVEKRTTTTSDPVMRGMSGFHILALVDGNTLSTLWGEGGVAGDDMYGKVDADAVERIEVVRGPSSVLYGSNALAGVVNFITKSSPIDFTEVSVKVLPVQGEKGLTAGQRAFRTFLSSFFKKPLLLKATTPP